MKRVFKAMALGLVILTAAIIAAAFRDTEGCHDWSWWTWWWGSDPAWFPPYVLAATLSLAGGTYVFARAASVRSRFALVWAGSVFVLGGLAIWFLALMDALTACPP